MLMALGASIGLAQSPFTIVRPADGSKVREVVKFQVPRSSVPAGGYIGVFVNGRFVEAVMPTERSTYFEYGLDTKRLELPDGPTKVELALFVDFSDQPRILDRSYVTVNIANKANIPIPASGLQLRYRLPEGTQALYDVEVRVGQETLTQAEAAKAGRPASLPLDAQKYTAEYTVINSFSNGDSLMFMRGLPPAGAKRTYVQTTNNPEGIWVDEKEFSQAYMRVTATGNEVYGSIPPAFSWEGMNLGADSYRNVYIFDPLPTLPVKRVRPGDFWQSRILTEAIDVSRLHDLNKLTRPIPARGELLGVEWEMGRPCAKIRHTLQLGGDTVQTGPLAGRSFKVEELFWFALDRGLVQKMIRTVSVDLGGFSAPAPGAQPGGPGYPAGPGAPGQQDGGGTQDTMSRQEGPRGGGRRPSGQTQGGPVPPGYPGFPGYPGGPSGAPAAPAPAPAPVSGFQRLVEQQTFILRG